MILLPILTTLPANLDLNTKRILHQNVRIDIYLALNETSCFAFV